MAFSLRFSIGGGWRICGLLFLHHLRVLRDQRFSMFDTLLWLSKPAFGRLEPVFLRMGGRRQAERRGGEKQKANWHVVTPVPMGEPKGCPKNARGAGPKTRGAPVVRIDRKSVV